MIPETQKSHQDVIDLLVDACQTVDYVEDPTTGKFSKQLILDPEKAWWKTQLINSPTFGMFAKVLIDLESMATDSKNHMCQQRAQVIQEQLLKYCQGYRYSIDAKSSETLRDKHNTQPALLDKMQKSATPHAVTKETERSMLSSWLGRDGGNDED